MADHSRKGGSTAGTSMSINPLYPLDAERYKFVDEIGRGVGSTVHKAICINIPIDSSVVAIKVIDLHKTKIDFVSEAFRLTAAIPKHLNILQPYCLFIVIPFSLWVVMPFISGGSLQSIVASSYPDGLPEVMIATVLKQISTGLSFLHGQGHHHRDIKAANILVNSFTGFAKLADFGVSTNARSWRSSSSTGTPYWMTPVVEYGLSCDIWSMGITELELAHGKSPLSHLKTQTKSSLMKVSGCFKTMVGRCLNRDHLKRPSADGLIFHLSSMDAKDRGFFLVKNMVPHGVRVTAKGINNRLKRKKCIEADDGNDDSYSTSGEIVENRMTSGWKFNSKDFYLDPIFPDGAAPARTSTDQALIDIESLKFMRKDVEEQKRTVRHRIEFLEGCGMKEDEGVMRYLRTMVEADKLIDRWLQCQSLQVKMMMQQLNDDLSKKQGRRNWLMIE